MLLSNGSFKTLGLLEGEWFFVQLMIVQVELIVECCDSSLARPIVLLYCPSLEAEASAVIPIIVWRPG